MILIDQARVQLRFRIFRLDDRFQLFSVGLALSLIHIFRARALEICTQILKDHERILFSGDGYSQEWVAEAKRRGLPNIPSFIESVSALSLIHI